MALGNCRECGKEVSSEAKACPHCGVSKPIAVAEARFIPFLVAVLVIGGLLRVLLGSGDKPVESAPAKPTDYSAAARAACQQFIARKLHDPDSAEWIEQWNWGTVENADKTWSVGARYRAKNGFGGVRTEYTTCVMTRTGESDWRLDTTSKMN